MPITSFLPVDLLRWDRGPGGDALVVPVWSDVRPLRGAAGLLDWRLCGRLSQMLRDGKISGAAGEKLLLATGRVAWQRVLAIGLGESVAFDEGAFRAVVDCCLDTLRRIGVGSLAIAFPGSPRTERARQRSLVAETDRHRRRFCEVRALCLTRSAGIADTRVP
jgi:hypothetical protein